MVRQNLGRRSDSPPPDWQKVPASARSPLAGDGHTPAPSRRSVTRARRGSGTREVVVRRCSAHAVLANPYPAGVLHELWEHNDDMNGHTFCLAGPFGDQARSMLPPSARLVWTVDAASHLEAMTLYYQHMGWGPYTTDFPEVDGETYAARGWE